MRIRLKANKRTINRRRLLLLFWGAILLSSVLIVGEVFSSSEAYLAATETSETLQEGTYKGSDMCGACHTDQQAAWEGTGHELAWNSSTHITPDRNCYTCHYNGTNFETGKFIGEDLYGFTATNTPQVDGVSCETCHGPMQTPVGPDHIPLDLSGELCGECHSPSHSTHGNHFERWSLSGHAESNKYLLERAIESPSCIHCHSAEGALYDVTTFAEVENGITCPVCHDPHSDENEHHLREATVFDTCVTCHSHETETGSHLGLETPDGGEADCATCHMYGLDYSTRLNAWEQNVNHTMSATIASCGQVDLETNDTTCHANPEASWLGKNIIQADYTELYALGDETLTAAHEAFERANTIAGADPAKLAQAKAKLEEIDELWHDIGHTGSQGFHNPDEMTVAIDQLILDCEEVIQLSEASVSEPNLPLLAVLGLCISLLVAALRRRRVA